MKIKLDLPLAESVTLQAEQNGVTVSGQSDQWGQAHRRNIVSGGRMNVVNAPLNEAKLQVDGSYTLALMDQKGAAYSTEVIDGLVHGVDRQASLQHQGWGAGEYYYLEVGGDDELIIEAGRDHRKIYASAGPNAYDANRISIEEGIAAGAVTSTWLNNQTEYGTQEKPLTANLAKPLFDLLNGGNKTPKSTWLLFERGYDYGGVNASPERTATGESPLYPMLIGSWGEGNMPTGILIEHSGEGFYNVVFQNIHMWSVFIQEGGNIMLDGLSNDQLSNHRNSFTIDGALRAVEKVTQRRTRQLDVWSTEGPVGEDSVTGEITYWEPNLNRANATYRAHVVGLLFDECLWDHNGWQDGYDPGLSSDYPQPPSMYSHNVYIAHLNLDVMFDRCISARAASIGLYMRPGGRITDCFMLDNNIASTDIGGDYRGAGPIGEYGLHLGNLVTSAGYRVAEHIGAINWGMDIKGLDLAAIDNIVCHMSNPADPAEVAAKPNRNFATIVDDNQIWNDTIHYNWEATNQGVEGLDLAVLDQTTIQNYAGDLLGTGTATIAEYLDHVRGLPNVSNEIDNVLAYFRTPYGKHIPPRVNNTTCTFKPDYRGEGFRWDNRLNWSTGDLPMTGDSVDMFGNDVTFGRYTRDIVGLTSRGGTLAVTSGKLTVADQVDAARIQTRDSGQYFSDGTASGDFTSRGGRLVFGAEANVNLTISGQAEVVFGPDLTIPAGAVLRIDGGRCFAGWTGTGVATLNIEGTLDMRSTVTLGMGTSKFCARYRQDHPLEGQVSGFTGIVDSIENLNRDAMTGWRVQVRDLQGTPQVGEVAVRERAVLLLEQWVPEVGAVMGAEFPSIRKFSTGMDGHASPTVTPTVNLSGPLHLGLRGMVAGSYPLIEAAIIGTFSGVTVSDLDPTLDASVNVSGAGVTLTLAAGSGQITIG